ncbi:hypothetical protein AB0J35_21720 [Nonomuraea angiospora]|uniref:hypothetical protein n=1 Tax=Nonomuraea angiospora TaxID=46172 RepID=UPI00343CA17E
MTVLEHTLAKVLTEIVIQLDLSDDDAITPEASMAVLKLVIALLQSLREEDQRALAELINQCARDEIDPERHLTAWEAPETLGLLA